MTNGENMFVINRTGNNKTVNKLTQKRDRVG